MEFGDFRGQEADILVGSGDCGFSCTRRLAGCRVIPLHLIAELGETLAKFFNLALRLCKLRSRFEQFAFHASEFF
jgi:hypothetical protein